MAIDFPNSPSVDEIYSVGNKSWLWNGTYWEVQGSPTSTFSASDTAPASPSAGDIWYRSDTSQTLIYYDSTWVEIGHSANIANFLADADADTKIQLEESADEDIIRFDTAGSERMTIGASGDIVINNDLTVDTSTLHVDSTNNRVGIGTTSPAYTVDVVGSSTSGTAIRTAGTLYVKSTQNWNYGSLTLQRDASNTANSKAISFPFEADSTADTNLYNYPNILLRTDSAPTTGSTAAALNAGIEITAPDTVRLGTNGAERMRVNSSGQVTMPYQPAFSVYMKGMSTVDATSPIVLKPNTISLNVGNCYSSSTGAFTAPISGNYMFFHSAFDDNSSGGTVSARFRINGSSTDYRNYSSEAETSTYKAVNSISAIFALSANDTVDVYLSNGVYHANQNVFFSGFLVG